MTLPDERIVKLNKSVYGLRQAAHNWYNLFKKTVSEKADLTASKFDECLFYRRKSPSDIVSLLIVHVDDHAQGTCNEEEKDKIFDAISSDFKVNETTDKNLYLGMNAFFDNHQNALNMKAYIERTLEDFELVKSYSVRAPSTKLLHPASSPRKISKYLTLVGRLAWIANTCRPDIAFLVNMLQRASHAPTAAHMALGLKLLRYLKHTIDKGQSYTCPADDKIQLEAYYDAAFGDRGNGYSTAGYIIMINGIPVSWKTAGLHYVATSTSEAELGALNLVVDEVAFIRGLINEILPDAISKPVRIKCDNVTAVDMIKGEATPARNRTIATKLAKIRRYQFDHTIDVEWIPTHDNIADILTKPLPVNKFKKHANKMLVDIV